MQESLSNLTLCDERNDTTIEGTPPAVLTNQIVNKSIVRILTVAPPLTHTRTRRISPQEEQSVRYYSWWLECTLLSLVEQ